MKEGAAGQGRGARRRAAGLRRQVRRRQRQPGRRDREPDRRRRQGHPDHAVATPRRSCRPIKKARDAGILVIALDTPLDPIDAADATFATDNFKAGELIGAWADGDARRQGGGRQDRLPRPRPEPADRRRSARPGLHAGLRHRRQGSQQVSATRTTRASSATTSPAATRRAAARRWRTCCRSDPDINVVYTINEPAAAGAYEALKAVGKEKARADRLDRRRLPGREERRRRASSARPRSSIRC